MDKENYYISKYIKIQKGKIISNESVIFSNDQDSDILAFLKEAYKAMEINYPKFHKMDFLCKLGILATSILLKDTEFSNETALVLSNASSSLNTDLKHQQSIENIVSPAIFVYTLPNIVLGEVSIKFGLQSENAFFIEKHFNPKLIHEYTEILLNSEKTPSVVCGWIEVKNAEYDVFLCFISKKGSIPFTTENLKKLYLFENE